VNGRGLEADARRLDASGKGVQSFVSMRYGELGAFLDHSQVFLEIIRVVPVFLELTLLRERMVAPDAESSLGCGAQAFNHTFASDRR